MRMSDPRYSRMLNSRVNMKLVHVQTRQVTDLSELNIPPYAVLSHTWSCDNDLVMPPNAPVERRMMVEQRVLRACEYIIGLGLAYLWVDALCIDSSSSADLEEAVNGSSRRLREAAVCLAYLDDLPADGPCFDEDIWRRCSYWRRAWTLQEVLLPSKVEFLDQQWNNRGSKTSPEFSPLLSKITTIPQSVLLNNNTLSQVSLAARISWSANRVASRAEDTAYSLVGITGVTMQLRYGEGAERAFLRLQEEILHDTRDGSIFAWRSSSNRVVRGLLARSPSEFEHFATASEPAVLVPWRFDGKVRFSSKGVRIQSWISDHGSYIMLEIGRQVKRLGAGEKLGVCLRKKNGIYVRVYSDSEIRFSGNAKRKTIDVARDVDCRTSADLEDQFSDYVEMRDDTSHQDGCGCGADYNAAAHLRRSQISPSMSTTNKDKTGTSIYELPTRLAHQSETATDDTLDEDGEPLLADAVSPGIKRVRSGKPKSCALSRPQCDHLDSSNSETDQTSFYSESELDQDNYPSSGSESGEDSESEDELPEDEEGAANDWTPEKDRDLQNIRSDLLQDVYEQIRPWMATANYVTPPEDRLPPRKRARVAGWQPQSAFIAEEEDLNDSQLVILSRLDGYFHLACPFYKLNPDRYKKCPLRHDLQSIEDVTRHLRLHHTEPRYCPICRQSFEKAADRDEHLQARTCEPCESRDVDGLDAQQKRQIVKRDKVYLGERRRWERIWDTIFLDHEPPRSPYLDNGIGHELSMVRDYWNSHGKDMILQHMASRALLRWRQPQLDRVLNVLHRMTMEDLLNKVFDDYTPAQDSDGDDQSWDEVRETIS